MHGVESLQLQGLYFSRAKLAKYKSAFLQDLAGNAFESSSCAATFLCSIVFLAANAQCRQSAHVQRSFGTRGGFGSESDSDTDADGESDASCTAGPVSSVDHVLSIFD